MKKKSNLLVFTAFMVLVSIVGTIFYFKTSPSINSLEVVILALIIIIGAIYTFRAFRKEKEQKEGFPADDEMSRRVKHKSGYYAYLGSMYMWFFIFIFKDKFPDTETMLGGGILLSALMIFVIEYFVKQQLHAE